MAPVPSNDRRRWFRLLGSWSISFVVMGACALAALGDLDPTFGVGGKVTTPTGPSFATPHSLAVCADGKVVVAGSSPGAFVLVRYQQNGALDSTFGTNGVVTTSLSANDAYSAIAVQGDGKIVAVGSSGVFFAVARYQIDGSLDSTFGTGGKVMTSFEASTSDRAGSVAVLPDGKILVGGGSLVAGRGHFSLARYTASGALDTTFAVAGKAITLLAQYSAAIRSIVVLPNGKIVAGGYSDETGTDSHFTLARYLANGTLDTGDFGATGATFTGGGVVITPQSSPRSIRSLGVQSDGTIIASGDLALARYHADGTLARIDETSFAQAMVVQNDDRIVGVGQAAPVAEGDQSDSGVARLNNTGTPDTAFGDLGVATCSFSSFDGPTAVAVQPDGNIVVAGWAWNETLHANDFAVARFLAASAPASPWIEGAVGSVSATGATFTATINPNGVVTTAQLEYGTTTAYGSTASVTLSPADGTSQQTVGLTLTGFQPATAYHYRFTASNALGTTSTADATFTTAPQTPNVSIVAPTAVTSHGAVLRAYVNPNGLTTTAVFEHGLGSGDLGGNGGGKGGKNGTGFAVVANAYDGSIAVTLSPDDGTTAQAVSATLSGLTPLTGYHYRISATNSAGTSTSSDWSFTTLPDPPAVSVSPATDVTPITAVIPVSVNPNGATTTASIDFGPDESYGRNANVALSPANGTTPQTVFVTLSGLSAHTTYHYRLIASNTGGTTGTTDATFTTSNNAPTVGTSVAATTTGETVMVTLPFANPDADGDVVVVSGVTASNGAPFTIGAPSGNAVPVTGLMNAAGSGVLQFTVSDGFGGSTEGDVQISVADNDAPVITILGENPAMLPVDATYVEAGATAVDAVSGALAVTPGGSVNSAVPGNYTITYTAVDAAGNGTTAMRAVVVPHTPHADWRVQSFGAEAGNPAMAGDLADPNHNGLPNLVEYALGGDPVGSTADARPIIGRDSDGHGALTFTRFPGRIDVGLAVQGSDSPDGPWNDLARSTGGGEFIVIASGSAVTEQGSGDARAVTVSDCYQAGDGAHPRRFLRLEITR